MDDPVTIGTLSIQKSTDKYMYPYGHRAVPIQMMLTAAITTIIPEPKLFVSHLAFIQLSKRLKHIKFDLNYVELILCEYNYGTHYTGDHFALALVFVAFTV